MYKYQCSKVECGSTWTLQEGCLNGFVLTCPICGKGRGVFVSQTKRELDIMRQGKAEQMTISVGTNPTTSIGMVNDRIEELSKNYSLHIIDKNIELSGNEIVCNIKYEK